MTFGENYDLTDGKADVKYDESLLCIAELVRYSETLILSMNICIVDEIIWW